MPLSNIRKVFKLLLADPWSNEGAIRQMTLYLDAAVIESKEAWKQASIEYQNGWRNVFNKKSRLKEDRQKLRENNRLTAASLMQTPECNLTVKEIKRLCIRMMP